MKKLNSKNKYAIGVDIGGTYIKYAIVDSNGLIIDKENILFNKSNPIKNIDLLSNNLKALIKKNKINPLGIGIGIPGILKDGTLLFTSNLGKWQGINVAKELNKRTKLKTFISNDGNVAALAEATFGSAKGSDNVIMLTLGTGVGGGIIINKQIYEGNKGQGAELGHMSIDFKGRLCGCGRRGCLEAYASASALTKQTIEEMNRNRKSIMWNLVDNDINKVDASTCFKAEKHNDLTAKKVIDNYISYLGEGILNYCIIFRPNVIVLGGGVAKQKANLTKRINEYLKDRDYGIKGTEKVKVVVAKLGYDAGVIGAASLVFSNIK